MDTLFNYRNDPDRNTAFQRAMAVLPPARLAEMLDENIIIARLPLVRPPRTDLATVLADIQAGLITPAGGRRQYSERDLRVAFAGDPRRNIIGIIDRIREETDAIAA